MGRLEKNRVAGAVLRYFQVLRKTLLPVETYREAIDDATFSSNCKRGVILSAAN
jgi:hypothetical protein